MEQRRPTADRARNTLEKEKERKGGRNRRRNRRRRRHKHQAVHRGRYNAPSALNLRWVMGV